MTSLKRMVMTGLVAAAAVTGANAADCELKLTTSAYINWNAINAADSIGLYDKLEKKHGCELKITYYPDYLQSLNAYVSGQEEAVTVTNLDLMTAIAPYPGDVVVLQDYSNGNDGLISRNGKTLSDLKGQEVWMVTKSISELLFVKAAEKAGLNPYRDFQIKHMDADSNLRAAYDAGTIDNIVTWNPALGYLTTQTASKATVVDSSMFPGLIVDTIVLNPSVEDFEKKSALLRDMWDATAKLINEKQGRTYSTFIDALATDTGSTTDESKAMLAGSKVFTPKEEISFLENRMLELQNDVYSVAQNNEFFLDGVPPVSYQIDGKTGEEVPQGRPSIIFNIK